MPLASRTAASCGFASATRGAGRSSRIAATSSTRLAQAASVHGLKRMGNTSFSMQAPASRPRRMLALSSPAMRFQSNSGVPSAAAISDRSALNSETSRPQSAQAATCRSILHLRKGPSSPPANSASEASLGCLATLTPPPRHVAPELDARVCNVRAHGGFRTIQPLRHFFSRTSFHIAHHQRRPLARRQQAQTVFQIIAVLAAQQRLFGRLILTLGAYIHFAERYPPVTPQKIDRRVGGDTRKPVRRLLLVFQLLLPLQRFDEGLLRQILCVGNVAYDAVDLDKDPPQIVGDKPVLPLDGLKRRRHDFAHDLAIHHSPALIEDDARAVKTWRLLSALS